MSTAAPLRASIADGAVPPAGYSASVAAYMYQTGCTDGNELPITLRRAGHRASSAARTGYVCLSGRSTWRPGALRTAAGWCGPRPRADATASGQAWVLVASFDCLLMKMHCPETTCRSKIQDLAGS